jgi:hypothetical protein
MSQATTNLQGPRTGAPVSKRFVAMTGTKQEVMNAVVFLGLPLLLQSPYTNQTPL